MAWIVTLLHESKYVKYNMKNINWSEGHIIQFSVKTVNNSIILTILIPLLILRCDMWLKLSHGMKDLYMHSCVTIMWHNDKLSLKMSWKSELPDKRMGITEILRRIWIFPAKKIKKKPFVSFSKPPTQLIVKLNSSLLHIIVTLNLHTSTMALNYLNLSKSSMYIVVCR